MTSPAPETIEREKEKLWVTDAELSRRLGTHERLAREINMRLVEPIAIIVLESLNCSFSGALAGETARGRITP